MKRQGSTILVIDDDENDRFMVQRAFRKNGVRDTIHLLADGADAVAYLNGEGKYADREQFAFPSIIITDLKMHRVNGFGVLKHLKNNPEWSVIPVIMLSGSADTDDIKTAYFFGANTFFTKPTNQADLQALLKRLYDYWTVAEVPQTDAAGRMLETESVGKIGEKA